ncbi:MAG: methyl-accepting chemotaxis protein [Cyanobacteria bacterium P01_G01_bin.38]
MPAALGLYGILKFSETASEAAISKFQQETLSRAGEIDAFLAGVGDDVLFLSRSASIQGMIRASASEDIDPDTGLSTQEWQNEASQTFIALAESKSRYQKFRYIDDEGNEIVRVEKDNDRRSQARIIQDEDLQNKSDRPFFNETIQLQIGEVAISRIGLQNERQRITQPFQPVLQYSTPVGIENSRGILVADVFADEFIDLVDDALSNETVLIIGSQGSYVSHPDESKEWGFDLGRDRSNFQEDYPVEIANNILSEEQGILTEGNQVFSYVRVNFSGEQYIYIIRIIDENSLFGVINFFKRIGFLVVIFASTVTLPFGIFQGKKIVSIFQQLVNGISSTSQQMSATVAEQENIASSQATSVHETTSTMEELRNSSKQLAQKANAAALAAKESSKRTKAGELTIEKSFAVIIDLENKVENLAQEIRALSIKIQQVSDISNTVSDFSERTRILSVNSSIESMKAGSKSKGFSIVTKEIESISEQTQDSIQKINQILGNIKGLIDSSVVLVGESVQIVKSITPHNQLASKAFQGIQKSLDTAVMNSQQIAITIKHQSDAIGEVFTAMDAVDQSARETATSLAHTLSGIDQLNKTASSLGKTV